MVDLLLEHIKMTNFDLSKVLDELAKNDVVVKEIGQLPLADKILEYVNLTQEAAKELFPSVESGASKPTMTESLITKNPSNPTPTKPALDSRENYLKRYQTPGPIVVKNSSDTDRSSETESSSDTDT